MTLYIAIGLSVVVTLTIVYLAFRVRHWRERWTEQYMTYADTLDRALQAEADRTKVATQYEFLRTTLLSLANRPAVAVLTDEQVHAIIQNVSSIVLSSVQPPDKMN